MGSKQSLDLLNALIPQMPQHTFLLDLDKNVLCTSLLQKISFGLPITQKEIQLKLDALPFFTTYPELLKLWEDHIEGVYGSKIPTHVELLCWDLNKNLLMQQYTLIPVIEDQKMSGIYCTAHFNQEHLKTSDLYESSFKTILTSLPGHVYWKDKEGRYLGCNSQQAADLNLNSVDEIIGKTDYDFSPKEQADQFHSIDQKVMLEGKEIEAEEQITIKGQPVIVLTRKIPLFTRDGIVIGVLGISFDISDRKTQEQELQDAKNRAEIANIAKTEFLNNMRHDIRTPLSGIVGFSEILKIESNELRIKEYADNLIASSHALLSLMDEVLEAVRVSAGEIPLIKKTFNLYETIEHVINLYLAKAHEKHLNLILELDEQLPQFVLGDKIRFHRIALELVGNALNFTDVGHVTVNVTLARETERHFIIQLKVSDSGIGIPKSRQDEIYIQFKRLTPSYQGTYKGAGLGLYVVKQFIDELNGEISVESEARDGTVFTCVIPLQKPLLSVSSDTNHNSTIEIEKKFMSPITHKHDTLPSNINNTTQSKILVVEDNVIAQTVAKTLLNAMSCSVELAPDGATAIDLFEKNQFDLIFMDIGLGEGMDGYEVTHYIRTKSNTSHHIPIIALTAHGGMESKQRCIEAGMDAVLTKPLTQAHAIDILKSFIPARKTVKSAETTKNRLDLPDDDEELFQLNQFPLLDEQEALKNCGTHEMLIELLTLMSSDLLSDLEQLNHAFTQQDYPQVEKIAHKIKGGAVYVGTIRMKYACQYVERYWKSEQRELFDALYHQAVITIQETYRFIKEWLQK
jgi:PAS domain S-box-containing protein